MTKFASSARRYGLVAGLGALGGGLLVAIAARALPRAMSRAMAGMMQHMMEQVSEGGHQLPDT